MKKNNDNGESLEMRYAALLEELRQREVETEKWKKRFERERRAKKEAESILEAKSRALYQLNIQLAYLNEKLAKEVKIQTNALERNVESLEKANKDLRQFTYLASHDLKTPLRSIGSLVGFIEQDLPNHAISRDLLECTYLIRTRVNRMHRLLNSILEYSNIGKQDTPKESVWVKDVVLDVSNSLSFEHQPTINIKDDLLLIDVNRKHLYKILKHIIENAVKYHHDSENVIIDIHSEKDDEFGKIYISDDGPGIAKRYHERIFQIFQTLATKDKNNESIGIGLPIVKKIIEEEINGKFLLESDEGEGTSFIICIPIKSVLR
ncbi:MAG: light-regulated signal transduction histidine kinase (bacteriophytochrome) [Cognaticolwellia sp.]|jgi:light-regulated signal transduction histidine kinase (bacteriophytochrome)